MEPTPAERSAQPDGSALDAIVHYYACFNARRFTEAANLFASGAVVEHIPGRGPQSREGYLQFAHAWLTAFPDVVLRVEHINERSDRLFDVDLVSSGTHRGDSTSRCIAFGRAA